MVLVRVFLLSPQWSNEYNGLFDVIGDVCFRFVGEGDTIINLLVSIIVVVTITLYGHCYDMTLFPVSLTVRARSSCVQTCIL